MSTERSQLHRSRPAGPVEDRFAEQLLERSDLLADRRLGVAEALGSASERPLVGDGVEGHQVPQFEITYRCHEQQRT